MRVTFAENNIPPYYFSLFIHNFRVASFQEGLHMRDLYLSHFDQFSTATIVNDSSSALAQLLVFADLCSDSFTRDFSPFTFPFTSFRSRDQLFSKFTPELARFIIQDRSFSLM